MIEQWLLRDQDSTCMNGEVVGKALHQLAITEDVSRIGVMSVRSKGMIDDRVDVGFGQSEHFTQFADDGFALESVVCGKQSSMFATVSFENVLCDIIAFVPGKIDIEIRWGTSVWVDKSLEIKI
jgi:hypothetical protein